MVILLGVRELMDAITGSYVGSLIDFGATFGNFSRRRKMDDCFSIFPRGGKGSPCLNCLPFEYPSHIKIRVTRLGNFLPVGLLLRFQIGLLWMFWAFKLSFVVDIFCLFLTWQLFGPFFEKFGNFFLIFWSG